MNMLEAIAARIPARIRRDEEGQPWIPGRCSPDGLRINGVYPYGEAGVVLLVSAASVRGWQNAKRRLAFCLIGQDGDQEGTLILGRPATADEANTIRRVLGIKRQRTCSPDVRQRMGERLRALPWKPAGTGVRGQKTRDPGAGGG